MLFKPEHVNPILEGQKTQTRRNWKRRMVKVGGTYKAKTQLLSRDYFALLEVTGIRKERLGDISEEDAKAEGGYTIDEFKTVWSEINGSWDPDLEVFVISFRVVASASAQAPI